jgi:hypothetical protein
LTERFCERHGRIGGNGPRSLEILLIHHDFKRLDFGLYALMLIVVLWFRRRRRSRGGHLGGNGRER